MLFKLAGGFQRHFANCSIGILLAFLGIVRDVTRQLRLNAWLTLSGSGVAAALARDQFSVGGKENERASSQ